MFAIYVFDYHLRDWTVLKDGFSDEPAAQKYVDDLPDFGHDYSRSVRQGDWQIVEMEELTNG